MKMSKSNYRNLDVWQKSRELAAEIYRNTRQFPRVEMFGLTQQMRRAAISIVCNIAEGHGRRTAKDTLQFLAIARGSLQELEAQTVIALDLEYVDAETAEALFKRIGEVLRLLNGFMHHYEKQSG